MIRRKKPAPEPELPSNVIEVDFHVSFRCWSCHTVWWCATSPKDWKERLKHSRPTCPVCILGSGMLITGQLRRCDAPGKGRR